MLKISSGVQILNRFSEFWITNLRCANRYNFIGHELFQTNTRTPLTTSQETKFNMLVSNLLEDIVRISNNQVQAHFRMVMPKSGKEIWDEMSRTGGTGGKFQDSCQLPGLVKFAKASSSSAKIR